MKKVVATIFLLTYFVASSGATIQLHYCMDKIVGWSLASKGKAKCEKCGMAKKGHKGCCHDENKIIQVDKDHKASFNSYELFKLQQLSPTNSLEKLVSINVFNPVTSFPTNNAPPILQTVPIYLSNSVFRI